LVCVALVICLLVSYFASTIPDRLVAFLVPVLLVVAADWAGVGLWAGVQLVGAVVSSRTERRAARVVKDAEVVPAMAPRGRGNEVKSYHLSLD